MAANVFVSIFTSANQSRFVQLRALLSQYLALWSLLVFGVLIIAYGPCTFTLSTGYLIFSAPPLGDEMQRTKAKMDFKRSICCLVNDSARATIASDNSFYESFKDIAVKRSKEDQFLAQFLVSIRWAFRGGFLTACDVIACNPTFCIFNILHAIGFPVSSRFHTLDNKGFI